MILINFIRFFDQATDNQTYLHQRDRLQSSQIDLAISFSKPTELSLKTASFRPITMRSKVMSLIQEHLNQNG